MLVTPFDVVKTRLQTQPPEPLFPRPPLNACCQPINAASCVRRMSSLAPALKTEMVCLWDHGVFRTERVNGFYDALRHVWAAEGARGLWKGVGTTLFVFKSTMNAQSYLTVVSTGSLQSPRKHLTCSHTTIFSTSPSPHSFRRPTLFPSFQAFLPALP